MNAYQKIRTAVRRGLLRSLQPCRQMVPLMSESMERRLRLRESIELKLHLLVCAWCARYLKHIEFIRQLLRDEMPRCKD